MAGLNVNHGEGMIKTGVNKYIAIDINHRRSRARKDGKEKSRYLYEQFLLHSARLVDLQLPLASSDFQNAGHHLLLVHRVKYI